MLVRYLFESPVVKVETKSDAEEKRDDCPVTDLTEFALRASAIALHPSHEVDNQILDLSNDFLNKPQTVSTSRPSAFVANNPAQFGQHLDCMGATAASLIDYVLTNAGFEPDPKPFTPTIGDLAAVEEDEAPNPSYDKKRMDALIYAARVIYQCVLASMRPLVHEQNLAAAQKGNFVPDQMRPRFSRPPCLGMTRSQIAAIPEEAVEQKKTIAKKRGRKKIALSLPTSPSDDASSPVALPPDFEWSELDAYDFLWLPLRAKTYNQCSKRLGVFWANLKTTNPLIDPGHRQILNETISAHVIPLTPERMYGFSSKDAHTVRRDASRAMWSLVGGPIGATFVGDLDKAKDRRIRLINFCKLMMKRDGLTLRSATQADTNEKLLIMRTLLGLHAMLESKPCDYPFEAWAPPYRPEEAKQVFMRRCALAWAFPFPSFATSKAPPLELFDGLSRKVRAGRFVLGHTLERQQGISTAIAAVGDFFQGLPNTSTINECAFSCLGEWAMSTHSLGERSLVNTPLSPVVKQRLSEQKPLEEAASRAELLQMAQPQSRQDLREIVVQHILRGRALRDSAADNTDDEDVIMTGSKTVTTVPVPLRLKREEDGDGRPPPDPNNPLPKGEHLHMDMLMENFFGPSSTKFDERFDFLHQFICPIHGHVATDKSWDHDIGKQCDIAVNSKKRLTLSEACQLTTGQLGVGRRHGRKRCSRTGCTQFLTANVLPPVLARFNFRYNTREEIKASSSLLFKVHGTGAQAITPESIGNLFLMGDIWMEPTGLIFASGGHFRAQLRMDPAALAVSGLSSSARQSGTSHWWAFDDLLCPSPWSSQAALLSAPSDAVPLWPRDPDAVRHPGGGRLCCVGPRPRFDAEWKQSDILLMLARRAVIPSSIQPAPLPPMMPKELTSQEPIPLVMPHQAKVSQEASPIIVKDAATSALKAQRDQDTSRIDPAFAARAAAAARIATAMEVDNKADSKPHVTASKPPILIKNVPLIPLHKKIENNVKTWTCGRCQTVNAQSSPSCINAHCPGRQKRKSAMVSSQEVAVAAIKEGANGLYGDKSIRTALATSHWNVDKAVAILEEKYRKIAGREVPASARPSLKKPPTSKKNKKQVLGRKKKKRLGEDDEDDEDDEYVDPKTVGSDSEEEEEDEKSETDDSDVDLETLTAKEKKAYLKKAAKNPKVKQEPGVKVKKEPQTHFKIKMEAARPTVVYGNPYSTSSAFQQKPQTANTSLWNSGPVIKSTHSYSTSVNTNGSSTSSAKWSSTYRGLSSFGPAPIPAAAKPTNSTVSASAASVPHPQNATNSSYRPAPAASPYHANAPYPPAIPTGGYRYQSTGESHKSNDQPMPPYYPAAGPYSNIPPPPVLPGHLYAVNQQPYFYTQSYGGAGAGAGGAYPSNPVGNRPQVLLSQLWSR